MKQGLGRLRENKLATAACAALVLALTALGVWTNDTAERQGEIEQVVRVQHTEVVQALCNRPYTAACLRRAINIVQTCLADDRCARLMTGRSTLVPRPDILGSQGGRQFRVGHHNTFETPNSSPENGGNRHQPEESPDPPKEDGDGDDGEGVDQQPEGPPGSGAPPQAGPPVPQPEPPEPVADGPAPSTLESVVGCVGELDLACTLGEVVGPAPDRR